MVFLHGGSNAYGTGAQTIGDFLDMIKTSNGLIDLAPIVDQIHSPFLDANIYTGHYFAGAQKVILVTINYRLGPQGHLAHPSVGEGSGNFTFLDIRKALEWVHFAIEDFGGNNGNVTLFGESSGAWDTCAMMNMPSARGLFNKAIMESQSCLSRTMEQAEKYGDYYVRNAGCDDARDVAKCLREVDVNAFFIDKSRGKPVGMTPFLPTVDGDIFPEHFAEALKNDTFSHVPLIIGSNENELYLNGLTDIGFNCHREANLAIFDDYLGAPIYEYRFDHRPLSTMIPTIHAFELPYVFGSAAEMFNHSKRENEVSRIVNSYWASFARTGNPNVPGQPFWPEYTGKSRRYLRLNAHPSVDSGSLIYHEENCLLSAELNALILGEQIVFW
jgi:para-nitrobenzyl esterase